MKKNEEIDIVLISDAKNKELKLITEQAIATAGDHPIIVVESNKKVSYLNAQTIYPTTPFNYNAYLNLGAKEGKSENIFFGNNDLIFTKNWDKQLLTGMKKTGVSSASPICPQSHAFYGIKKKTGIIQGLEIREHFCGWAFMWKRSLFEEVGGLDDTHVFWCSDNVTVEQLKRHNKSHILVTTSIVNHIGQGSKTLETLEDKQYYTYTKEELNKFNKSYNKNIEFWDARA